MNKTDLAFSALAFLGGENWTHIKKNILNCQYSDESHIEMNQLKMLKKVLIHAYENVPFYKNHFDACLFNPYIFSTIQEIEKIPVISKDDVNKNRPLFLSQSRINYHPKIHRTGGTTGTAFEYIVDKKAWLFGHAYNLLQLKEVGVKIGKDCIVVLAGGSLSPQSGLTLSKKVWGWIMGYHYVPITHMTDDSMLGLFQMITERKIHYMRGYPSAIYTFAKYLKEQELFLPLKAIFTTAEMLHPYHRELFREIFQCEVFDQYGCADGSPHALDCEKHNGLHISPLTSILQVVDKHGKEVEAGVEGDIVATSLNNYTMPLIRYAPGDRAIKSSKGCTCGKTTRLLEKVIGRVSDVIEFSNGIRLNGLSIPFEDFPGERIKLFQLVQVERDKLEFNVVIKNGFMPEDEENILTLLRYHCGKDVEISFNYVDSIELPSSGKMRYIISRINDKVHEKN